MMRVLILGATGMLGHTLFRVLNASAQYETVGTLRNEQYRSYFQDQMQSHLIHCPDVLNQRELIRLFNQFNPDVVINCVGIIKQLASANDPLTVLPINAMLPHQLADICALNRARLVHISTDCVFLGTKGNYHEDDVCDAQDLYGQSKAMGEVKDKTHAITLRTSIIGHELGTHHALVDWFLSEKEQVRGFSKAIFSGVPTIELARIIRDFVLPNKLLHGLYHVASAPINKYDLLKLIKEVYQHPVKIEKDPTLVIDRSLNGLRFIKATGYTPLPWDTQIELMYQSR